MPTTEARRPNKKGDRWGGKRLLSSSVVEKGQEKNGYHDVDHHRLNQESNRRRGVDLAEPCEVIGRYSKCVFRAS